MGSEQIKRLEGWVTSSEAARMLGMTKQGVSRLLFRSVSSGIDLDRDVRKLGDRDQLVIRTSAVHAELAARAARAASQDEQ